MQNGKTFYIVTFRDPATDKVTTMRVNTIYDSLLGIGFVCLSDFIFESDSLVVNPEEENLAKKYKDTKSLHLSLYSILTIEEVGMDNKGMSLKADRSTLHILPSPNQKK